MYIVIDEQGSIYKATEITESMYAAIDAGVLAVVGCRPQYPPMEVMGKNKARSIGDYNDFFPEMRQEP